MSTKFIKRRTVMSDSEPEDEVEEKPRFCEKLKVKPLTPYQIARINKSLGKPSAKDEFIIKIRERDVDF